jgi:hypothetical protein
MVLLYDYYSNKYNFTPCLNKTMVLEKQRKMTTTKSTQKEKPTKGAVPVDDSSQQPQGAQPKNGTPVHTHEDPQDIEQETIEGDDAKPLEKELIDEDLDAKDAQSEDSSEIPEDSNSPKGVNTKSASSDTTSVPDIASTHPALATPTSPAVGTTDNVSVGELDLKQASELAKQKLSQALNKAANATISIEDTGDSWLATVEIIEEEYLPGQQLKSMNDLLGVYEIQLGHNGKLLKWKRKGSYKRSEIK